MSGLETPADKTKPPRRWTSRAAFLIASIGAAVGLGNLWRFPFQTGQNGGAAFVVVYLLCVALIVYPVMIGELAVGRAKGRSAVGSTATLAVDAGHTRLWGAVGLIGVLASYLVLTTYSVIAGRIVAYAVMAFLGVFNGGGAADLPLYAGSSHALLWHTAFMAATVFVVVRGLRGGIERFTVFLMPLFFLMLAGLSIYALTSGAGERALTYLFSPRFGELTPSVALAALGQAFFSVAVGGGVMITYGAFLNRDENIVANGAIIAGADTGVAIIAGLMIFPVVFAAGLDPAAGMGLIFQAMPAAFATMPFGQAIGGLFFALAFVAAITSSMAMLLLASVVGEEQLRLPRRNAVYIFGAIAWAIGAASIVVPHLSEQIDFLAGHIAMPVGGFLAAVFAGWIAPRDVMRRELSGLGPKAFAAWRIVLRYLAPAGIGTILVLGLL
ncbi:MAG: sodium-dependent transporter [Pseudomonadota bacterium]